MKKKLMLVLMAMATMLALVGTALAAETTYSTVVEIGDWGAAVTKVIVDLGKETSGTVDKDTFSVFVTRSDDRLEKPELNSGYRRVTNAYLSDENGKKAVSGRYATIEMAYGPAISLSSALNYTQGRNVWIDYDCVITQNKAIGDVKDLVATKLSGTRRLGIEDFTTAKGTYEGIEMSYAYFTPDSKDKQPLIIWLHGGGEGGTDATIPLAANKAGNLATETVQKYFKGGAYVLAPQAPTAWMDTVSGKRDGTSKYTESLMALINEFVSQHNVDANRIYVGGCSNGGYMTMVLALNYSDYFAAYYPVCEGLADTLVTDEQIDLLKDLNIWFIHSATDTTLVPTLYTIPTYVRIKEAGSDSVHFTFFPNVCDQTGLYRAEDDTPHEYDGHWSWTYVYNDQVFARIGNQNTSLWQWMAAQSK